MAVYPIHVIMVDVLTIKVVIDVFVAQAIPEFTVIKVSVMCIKNV